MDIFVKLFTKKKKYKKFETFPKPEKFKPQEGERYNLTGAVLEVKLVDESESGPFKVESEVNLENEIVECISNLGNVEKGDNYEAADIYKTGNGRYFAVPYDRVDSVKSEKVEEEI